MHFVFSYFREIMKVLLIDPPFRRFTRFVNFYFPIGLASLASVLREAEHEVAVFDVDAVDRGDDLAGYEYKRLELYRQGLNDGKHAVWREIEEVLKDYKPDLVGITAMTTKFGSVLKTAEIVKRYDPNIRVVAGGPHSTFLSDQTLESENIDIVVRGEGETTFLNLVNSLETKNGFQELDGISFRQNGDVLHNPPQEFIPVLDALPFPARDALMHPHNYTTEDMGGIITSRGCPFSCSYCCHMWQKKVRRRSAENVVEEVKAVKGRYGTTQFDFKDDTFTLNRKRVMELCDTMIAEKVNVNWACSTRANLLDDGLVKKMKKAGCNVVKLGIETGSERILKETNKGVTFDEMRRAADLLNRNGLFWSGYFMVGLPTETEEDILKTHEFMKELNPYYAALGVYNPFPKTDLFDRGVELGLITEEVDLSHFFDTNPKDYYFIDSEKRVQDMGKEKFDEISAFMMEKFHKHNTKLTNMLRRGWARRRVYARDRRLLVDDLKKAFRWLRIKD